MSRSQRQHQLRNSCRGITTTNQNDGTCRCGVPGPAAHCNCHRERLRRCDTRKESVTATVGVLGEVGFAIVLDDVPPPAHPDSKLPKMAKATFYDREKEPA